MRAELFFGMTKVVTSLKVAALVSVLGAVVLAAEHRLEAAPDQMVVRASVAAADSKADRGGEQARADYFPANLAAPSGPTAEQPPTN